MSLSDDFLATLAGATVAGLIGLVTLLIQQRLESRRRLDEEFLAPAFSYIMALPTECPWTVIPEPVWASLDSYHWLKIPVRYRLPLRDMSVRLDAYSKSNSRYATFMGETGWASFGGSVRTALSQYVTGDGTSILAKSVGLESGALLQIQWIVVGIVPYILLNPDDSARAWEQLIGKGPNLLYWAEQVVRAIQKTDPPALQKLFEAVVSNPDSLKARELVREVHKSFGEVSKQAGNIKQLLATRLKVRV
jgi:hypothetical protein